MPNENEEITENSQLQAPSADENVNLENQSSTEESTKVEATEEKSVAQEGTEEKTEDKTQQLPEHFRKGYEALEKDVNEKYKPVAKVVDELGGIEVVKALAPLAELIANEDADQAQVIETLKQTLLPQHLEALAWASLDNPETQAVVLEDPEVLQVLSDKFFNGKSISEVQAALQFAVEAEDEDPEKAELRKQLKAVNDEKKSEQDRVTAKASEDRVNDLQKRFFMDTADEVVKQFNLAAPDGATEADRQMFTDTVDDLRFAAQGRFLHENQQEYLKIQDMYARGLGSQARVIEARLHNKWQATLIKTAERMSNNLKDIANARQSNQQAKVQGVRPDVNGNAGQTQQVEEERYDLNDPNWLQNFQEQFRQERVRRGV